VKDPNGLLCEGAEFRGAARRAYRSGISRVSGDEADRGGARFRAWCSSARNERSRSRSKRMRNKGYQVTGGQLLMTTFS